MPNTLQQTYSDLPQMEYKMKDPVAVGATDREVTCQLCKLVGKEKTPYHLAAECLGVWRTRRILLGSCCFSKDDIQYWETAPKLEFFKHFHLENKPNTL